MKTKRGQVNRACFALVLANVFLVSFASAQTSVFTYQGRLNDGGVAANATYDMRFRLFDALASPNQIGTTLTIPNVHPTAGIFSVPLDFGAVSFPGADRFLEVAVSPAGQNNFTTLAPRQPLTSTPYSTKASTSDTAANSLNLGGTAANQFVQTSDARLSDARVPLPGSGNYVQNTTTQQATANFNVDGTGAANILNAGTQFNLGGNRILFNTGTENLFAGANAGASNTSVGGGGFSNTFLGHGAGTNNSIGNQNAFVGANAGLMNTFGSGNAFFGAHAGENSTTGSLNSFFGLSAGIKTTGSLNSFFGRSAGFNNTTADSNSFYGAGAGFASTTGGSNSFFGDNAGNDNTTGSNNVFLGVNSGNPNTATQVSNSVAIGVNSVVSTSNTIVLGTSAQHTKIPGGLSVGSSAVSVPVGGGVGEFFNNGSLSGLLTGNVFVTGLNSILASPVHLCIRTTSIGGGFGGEALSRCTPSSPISDNKDDVQPFVGGLDVVKRLKPVSFRWKADNTSDVGLNADDVAQDVPQIVTRNAKGEVEDVKEGSLDLLLINAVKEQQAQIDRQQQQIDALKKLVCQADQQAAICRERE